MTQHLPTMQPLQSLASVASHLQRRQDLVGEQSPFPLFLRRSTRDEDGRLHRQWSVAAVPSPPV